MRASIFTAAATLVLCSAALPTQAEDFSVFKASIMFTVEKVIPGVGGDDDKVVKKGITSKEFVNLSLGRPIDQPLDPQHEVFALAVAFEDPTDPASHQPDLTPNSKFILWDPDPAVGNPNVVKVLAKVTELDFDDVYATGHKGQGIGTISIQAGAGPDNKFFASTLRFAGHATTPALTGANNQITTFGVSLTGLSGRVYFQFTTRAAPAGPVTDWWGVAVKGSVKTAGKSFAHFVE